MPEQAEEGDIEAIFARLKEEVRGRSAPAAGEAPPGRPLESRSRAERAWAITADRPFEHRPGRRGVVQAWLVVPVKRAVRRLMRWYVEPVAADQRSYNLAMLNLVDELAGRYEADVQRIERRPDLANARPRRGSEPPNRPRDRDEVPVVRDPPPEQGRLARPPIPPGVRARRSGVRTVRTGAARPRHRSGDSP